MLWPSQKQASAFEQRAMLFERWRRQTDHEGHEREQMQHIFDANEGIAMKKQTFEVTARNNPASSIHSQ